MHLCIYDKAHQFKTKDECRRHMMRSKCLLGKIIYRCHYDIEHMFLYHTDRELHEIECPTLQSLRALLTPANITARIKSNKHIIERVCKYSPAHIMEVEKYEEHISNCSYQFGGSLKPQPQYQNKREISVSVFSIKLDNAQIPGFISIPNINHVIELGAKVNIKAIPFNEIKNLESRIKYEIRYLTDSDMENCKEHGLMNYSSANNKYEKDVIEMYINFKEFCFPVTNAPAGKHWYLTLKINEPLMQVLFTPFAIIELSNAEFNKIAQNNTKDHKEEIANYEKIQKSLETDIEQLKLELLKQEAMKKELNEKKITVYSLSKERKVVLDYTNSQIKFHKAKIIVVHKAEQQIAEIASDIPKGYKEIFKDFVIEYQSIHV